MKQLPILLLLAFMGACKAPAFSVTDRKTTPKPYAKILTICVDGEYNFALLDSTLYNICIVNYFNETDKKEERDREDALLAGSLSSSHTEVVRIPEAFLPEGYNYKNLKALIDSSGIEAIFIYDLLRHTSVTTTTGFNAYGRPVPNVQTENGAFKCYLVDAKSNRVVWSGQSELKGRVTGGRRALTPAAARSIAKELAAGMYIIADR